MSTEDAEDQDGPDSKEDGDTGAAVGHDLDAERTTAPMSDYTLRDVGVGLVVFLIGTIIAFGIPMLVA